MARFFDRVEPCGLLIMETELWPNWLAACGRRRIPVAVLNARLSERSCQRYQKVRGLFRVLTCHLDLIVITSYSIHYTKLYEPSPVAAAYAAIFG